MFEETGLLVRLTRLVGVFGGPEFVIHYRNGDRTSYVMAVFEAEHIGGAQRPDGVEVTEVRFVTESEAAALPKAQWMSEVLEAIFRGQDALAFRTQGWQHDKRRGDSGKGDRRRP
jgi:ADP-ribose pyrophosphatase YjhB (NUDIX family)